MRLADRSLIRLKTLLFRADRWLHRDPGLRVQVRLIDGAPLLVPPEVFDPAPTLVGGWLAEIAAEIVRPGERWIDLGCGSGVVGLAMAVAGAEVIGLDVDPAAIRATRINAALRGARVEAQAGDLFAALPPGEVYDGILTNPPYWPGAPDGSRWSRAMRAGPRLELLTRIADQWPRHARRLLVGLSEAGGHADAALAALSASGGQNGEIRRLRQAQRGGERLILSEILRAPGSVS